MKVFISWSKDKSRLTAEALNKWIPKVIQAIEPWISTDIEKGKRWSQEINDNLEKTKVGIFCLNQENLNEPWILFEAGAMAKTKDAHVCTFLLDITPTDVQQPLAQFHHTKYEKEDIRKLIHTINTALDANNEKSLKPEVLNDTFEKYWGDLDKELKEIKKKNQSLQTIKRPDRELLEEILEIMRHQQSSNIYFTNSVGTIESGGTDDVRVGMLTGYNSPFLSSSKGVVTATLAPGNQAYHASSSKPAITSSRAVPHIIDKEDKK